MTMGPPGHRVWWKRVLGKGLLCHRVRVAALVSGEPCLQGYVSYASSPMVRDNASGVPAS